MTAIDPNPPSRLRGRRPIPDKLTCGTARSSDDGWRYWTRLNGVMTWGPTRCTRGLARDDLRAALAANAPPKAQRPGGTQKSRLERGLCRDCNTAPLPGRASCQKHIDAKREAARRHALRRKGLAPPVTPDERRLTRDLINAKINQTERCPCGLLLPCHGAHRIEEYAGRRTAE